MMAELGQMAVQGIDGLRALARQEGRRPVQALQRLLRLALHRHRAQIWPARRLGDRARVAPVVLAGRIAIGLHALRRQQQHPMPAPLQLPAPMMRAPARLERHRRSRMAAGKRQRRLRPHPALLHNRSGCVDHAALHNPLCQIEGNDLRLRHGGPSPLFWRIATPCGPQ
jgi:hypothetical protein